MRIGLWITIATLVAVISLPSRALAARDVPVLGPGLHTQTLEREGRPAIGYAIVVPPGYTRATKAPLVLALHFGVQGGPSLFAGRDLVQLLVGPALAELGAIIVAPDALNGGPWETPQNDEAVLALVDAVMASYGIDPKKVIVTGYSMGGAGVWHFAGAYPDRFAAAVPVAGRPPAAAGSWRVPVFAVHSRGDRVVPIGPTEQRIEELKRAGVKADLVALDSPTHYQTSAHVQGLRLAVPWLRQLWK
ncbi:MAG: alpha/beta fold hydrolase [Acidobacteria bacterium]|nr:alpha/beta fold hydrolase [Acidobacteriota bacterium]